jgi:hypothetical protein
MAGLQPTVDILELFALQMPGEKFSGLLVKRECMLYSFAANPFKAKIRGYGFLKWRLFLVQL